MKNKTGLSFIAFFFLGCFFFFISGTLFFCHLSTREPGAPPSYQATFALHRGDTSNHHTHTQRHGLAASLHHRLVPRPRCVRSLMAFQSSPSLPRRKYGSVEQDEAARSHLLPGTSERGSFDHVRENAAGLGEQPSGRRWFSFAVVGTLAVGVMLGLAQAGYRLPTAGVESVTNEPSLIQQRPDITRGSGGGMGQDAVTEPATPATAAELHPSRPAFTADSLPPLSFEALNFYHVRDGKPALDYPWLKEVKLIEPHRETTLVVTSPRDGFEYNWVVRGGDPEKAELRAEASGAEAVITLTILDDNVISLEEVDQNTGVVVRRLEEKVMVKYVRRELRTLTDDEREELFDAVSGRTGWALLLLAIARV